MSSRTANFNELPPLLACPVLHVRGGTSTGLIIAEEDVPAERELREELLRHLMGVPLKGVQPGNTQVTGFGRIVPTSNKVFFAKIERTEAARPKIISTLAQLAADSSEIDWSVNCGNMSAALPLWALERGIWQPDAAARSFEIEIFNTNTRSNMVARMTLSDEGTWNTAEIDGVNGAFPAVDLFLANPVGAKTGRLLPTSSAIDTFDGIEASCVDVAVPMVILRATDLGKTAAEPVETLQYDDSFMDRLKRIWIEAGLKMGLRKTSGELMSAADLARSETIPKICIVGRPQRGGNIAARYFTPQAGHRTMAVSGGCCLAAACLIPGTVANECVKGLAGLSADLEERVLSIEHPAGFLAATIVGRHTVRSTEITQAAYKRSAQVLIRGNAPVYAASTALRAAYGSRSAYLT